MNYHYDRDKYIDLKSDQPNIIHEGKTYLLPYPKTNFCVVEIFLTDRNTVMVESRGIPIRYGKHLGSIVRLSCLYGKVDYNPKLIWDGYKKEWFLQTHGTFLFPEVEVNCE